MVLSYGFDHSVGLWFMTPLRIMTVFKSSLYEYFQFIVSVDSYTRKIELIW